MKKMPVEKRPSESSTPRLKVIRNKPEAVQEMLWKIALNGQARNPIGSLRSHEFFNCSEKE